ncbi:TetR/AcrR family tetracycline transcriptional repressor [Sphingobium sp. B11D3B]|uniref:TetR family transcriptional regulator n=1 Tax=Sphingobium sp. B11D3B TaxID=2940575 RepID=UPI002227A9A7|nr:TetR family transcriptional regulator [Sphingobium sp. B11D3B]MCW2388463.1 TetR/AcrR family tetracycline transcriptional repressor [Sphingobium sp. B11D3B]
MASTISVPLDIERLLHAAFAQLEADGLDALSMRKLAARLNVQAPAIYWHVKDKAELLGLMARRIHGRAYADVTHAEDWRDWLRQFGRALRRSFLAHRDGALLCAVSRPPAEADPAVHAHRIAAPLLALGLPQQHALARQAAVISFVLGWSAFEANGPMHSFLDRILDFEGSFEPGLDALVAGFPEVASEA